jgi:hypothetical protein
MCGTFSNFSFIERKDQLEQTNLQVAKEFKQTAERHMNSSESFVKEFVNQQTKRFNSLHNDISSFIQQKDKVRS